MADCVKTLQSPDHGRFTSRPEPLRIEDSLRGLGSVPGHLGPFALWWNRATLWPGSKSYKKPTCSVTLWIHIPSEKLSRETIDLGGLQDPVPNRST